MLNWKEWFLWFVISLWLISTALPASIWYNTGRLQIPNYLSTYNPEIHYTGSIEQPFKGSYSIIVRDSDTGEVVAETPRSGVIQYRPGSKRPDPLTLEWWSNNHPKVMNLPRGSYELETCWTINPPIFFMLPKTTCTTSNIFEVY